jgi:hypothetical protein
MNPIMYQPCEVVERDRVVPSAVLPSWGGDTVTPNRGESENDACSQETKRMFPARAVEKSKR